MGEDLNKVMQYVKQETSYDTSFLYEYLLETKNIEDIILQLNLLHILPVDDFNMSKPISASTGIFVYLYYPDLFEYSLHRMQSVPDRIDIYIATDTESKAEQIRKLCQKYNVCIHHPVLIHKDNGRDVSALLITFRPYLMRYELLCFLHDK